MKTPEIFGQWWGKAKSHDNLLQYRTLLSIDENEKSLSSVSRIKIKKVEGKRVFVEIQDFKAFRGEEILESGSGEDYFVPHNGECELEYHFDSDDNESLKGSWQSRLYVEKAADIVLKGAVEMFKVILDFPRFSRHI